MEHKANEILSEHFAKARLEKPRRKLVLHTEPAPALPLRRPSRRWTLAAGIASGLAAAAAIIAGVFLSITPEDSVSDDLICYVNGRAITDRVEVEEYTRQAFELINDNLGKPAEMILAKADGSDTMERIGEMINELIKTE